MRRPRKRSQTIREIKRKSGDNTQVFKTIDNTPNKLIIQNQEPKAILVLIFFICFCICIYFCICICNCIFIRISCSCNLQSSGMTKYGAYQFDFLRFPALVGSYQHHQGIKQTFVCPPNSEPAQITSFDNSSLHFCIHCCCICFICLPFYSFLQEHT